MKPEPPRGRAGFVWKLLGVAAGIAVVVAAATVLWQSVQRLNALEEKLRLAEQRAETVSKQMTEYSRELALALERAREAGQRADASDAQRSEALSKAERAQRDAEQAHADTQAARERIEQLRRQREQELDRMQQALNRIAPTRRTPLGMVVEIANDSFKFDFDKSTLRPENREMLSRIAGVLLASSGYRLQVYGHTDDIGTDEYNDALSERRAQAVADYLIDAGVPRDIISIKGFGKSSPRVKGTSNEARQRNRRVEIGIVDTIVSYKGLARNPQP